MLMSAVQISTGGSSGAAAVDVGAKAQELELIVADQSKLKEILRVESLRFHHLFHPSWGQLFKAGYQDSRFAQQVS